MGIVKRSEGTVRMRREGGSWEKIEGGKVEPRVSSVREGGRTIALVKWPKVRERRVGGRFRRGKSK